MHPRTPALLLPAITVLLAAAAVAVTAPAADGALLAVSVLAPEEPLRPATEVGRLQVVLQLDCTELLLRDPAMQGTPVHVEFTADEGILVNGSLERSVPASVCPVGGATEMHPLDFEVQVTAEAPALSHLTLRATVTMPAAAVFEERSASGSAEVTAEPFFATVVRPAGPATVGGGGGATTALLVLENHGNGAVRYTFHVAGAPERGTVEVPEPVFLEPLAGDEGAGRAEVEVRLHAPRGPYGAGPVKIVVSQEAADDPAWTGPDQETEIDFQATGWKRTVPAPALAPLGLALAAAAGLAARRDPGRR